MPKQPRSIPAPRAPSRTAVAEPSKAPPPPETGFGSGAYIRSLLQLGYQTTTILDAVHSHYPHSKAGPSDVAWNKGKLREMQAAGITDVAATPPRENRKTSAAVKKTPKAATPAAVGLPWQTVKPGTAMTGTAVTVEVGNGGGGKVAPPVEDATEARITAFIKSMFYAPSDGYYEFRCNAKVMRARVAKALAASDAVAPPWSGE